MVFGRLIRSIGLGKAQATPEEKLSHTTSAKAGDSITNDVADEHLSEVPEPSTGLVDGVHTVEVYSKMMLLRFHAVVDERPADEIPRAMPWMNECSSELDRSVSTRSTPKSNDSPSSRLDALTPTAGSWTAAMQSKRVVSDACAEDERVTRKACAILNKLTVEKFDSLFEQLATCGITKPEHLEMLMREVFNKATTQHHFIAMYANLCVRLEQDKRISSVVGASGEQHSFRRLLLNQCQMSFENLIQPGEMHESSKECDMDEEYALKRKQQALGNIKLIGQLLVHGIVNSKLLAECSEELLRCRDSCPEALESLAALLTVAGKQFDTKNWQYHPRLLEVFSCMRKLSKDKSTQARVRFLLRDVLDVRDAGWSHCTYKATLALEPMKLDEVADSAANEGKYMSLEDQIETDSLLAGLMAVSQAANAKTNKSNSVPDSTPMQSKSGRHKPSRSNKMPASNIAHDAEMSLSKRDAAGQRGVPKHTGKQLWEATPNAGKQLVLPTNSEATHLASTLESSPRETQGFDVVSFRRALASILVDLASDRNVPAAVRRMRLQEVPIEFQAKEFVDIITRIVEERRGPIRRCELAFAAGLGAAEQSAFDRNACLTGIGQFLGEVYPELCNEIPRLPAIATSELLPTLRNVYTNGELDQYLPEGFGPPPTS